MKAVAIVSAKGGVGKSTLALHLAHATAIAGYRTLLIDTDPQGAIGLSLSQRLTEAAGLTEYLSESRSLDDVIIQTRVPDLHLLTVGRIAPDETSALGMALADGRLYHELFSKAARTHDLILVDTPCGFGGITVGAMRAARHLISPVQAEPIAARTVRQLLQMMVALNNEGEKIELVGLVLSMLQIRSESSYAVARDVWDKFPARRLFDTHIPRDSAFLEASAAGVPVGLLSTPAPPVARVFDLLAAELVARLGMKKQEATRGPIRLVD